MASPPTPPVRVPLSERMTGILAEFGTVALVVYLVLFVAVLAGFAVAISAGVAVESAAGGAGTLAAAWLATKVTQPLRILATLAITPIVAALVHRLRGGKPAAAPPVEPPR